MKLLSSIIIGAIHCSQQSVNQSAAVDEFVDQRLTCRQQCFKYEIVDSDFLLGWIPRNFETSILKPKLQLLRLFPGD